MATEPLLNTCKSQNITLSLNEIGLGQNDHAVHKNRLRKGIKTLISVLTMRLVNSTKYDAEGKHSITNNRGFL